MKKIIALGLTLMMTVSMLAMNLPVGAAEIEEDKDWEISVLSQLGLLDNTEPDSDVSKETMANGLIKLLGGDVYVNTYFADQDLSKPLRCGQAAMILIDVLGYTEQMRLTGKNTSDANAYMIMARELKMISEPGLNQYSVLNVRQYAHILYQAVAKTAPFSQISFGSNSEYEVLKNVTLLSERMKIKIVQGIVYGTDAYSITGSGPQREGYINIGGIVYSVNDKTDRSDYVGKFVRAYVEEEEDNICALTAFRNNDIVKIASEDIAKSSDAGIEYYDGNRKETAALSETVDVIYNRELLTSYTAADFEIPDSEYTLIDNNNDGRYEVVLIEHYTSKLVEEVAYTTGKILLKDGEILDINEYFKEGYKLHDAQGNVMDFSVLSRSQVLSYLVARSGEYTNMVSSSHKVTGTLKSLRDNNKYITIDEQEYECTEDYLKNVKGNEEVKIGDRVTAAFDVLGKIVDITVGSTNAAAGYLIKCWEKGLGKYFVGILDENGKIREIPLRGKVAVDGSSMTSKELVETKFMKNGEVDRQLILFKESGEGEITSVEIAENKSALGSRGNNGFTLDYNFEKDGELRALNLNGKKILGSKYVVRDNTVVFTVCTNDLDESYVQQGDSIPTLTGLNIKLYNVNNDYDIQYAVREFTRTVGSWVDFWGDTYMVDRVYQTVNKEGESVYALDMYMPNGKKKTALMEDGTITTNEWNIMSGDKSLSTIQAKDLKRGTVVEINEDFTGLTGIAVQHVPKKDGDALIFEAITSETGNEYGLNEKTFNGGYLMSYGKVIARTRTGIIVNNHLPGEEETAEGATYPMDKWNRTIPLNLTDKVLVYDSESDQIEVETGACIMPGDHVFTKRMGTEYRGVFVYR